MTDEFEHIDDARLSRLALERIATAVEKIMAASPDPKKPLNLRDLTDDERQVIEALRDGKLALIPINTVTGKTGYVIGGAIEPG